MSAREAFVFVGNPALRNAHPVTVATYTAIRSVTPKVALPGSVDGWLGRLQQAATSEHARADLLRCIAGAAGAGARAIGDPRKASRALFDAAIKGVEVYLHEQIAVAERNKRTERDADNDETIGLRQNDIAELGQRAKAVRDAL